MRAYARDGGNRNWSGAGSPVDDRSEKGSDLLLIVSPVLSLAFCFLPIEQRKFTEFTFCWVCFQLIHNYL